MDRTLVGEMKVQDAVSGENCYVEVNTLQSSVGIVISQEGNGDAEVFLKINECQTLIEWLRTAIHQVA